MSAIKIFFHFCSGIHEPILKRTPTDSNKYAGIGATIFFTGIFATVAAGFAVYTVFHSYVIAIGFGLLWGLMIFNLDRYIVMSMKKKDNFFKEFLIATPRIFLALLIAFVISKPLELKLFESEIRAELVSMEQEVFKVQEDKLKTRFLPAIDSLKNDVFALNVQVEQKRVQRDAMNLIAIQEADGTGGSMKRNLGPIYKAKKADADQAQNELELTIASLTPVIQSKQKQIANLETSMQDQLVSLKQSALDGFAAQLDALGRLASRSSTIWFASIFITLLFIAIETAPIFTKLISSRSPYDYKLDEHEYLYKAHHTTVNSRFKNKVDYDLIFDKEVNKYKNQLAIAAEKEILKSVIAQEVEKVKERPLTWKTYLQARNIFSSYGS